ncbi:MAG: hypothetical protein LBL05_06220 [Synergistaceae bacterium]|jgi:hypothetical protein|nr:hypothetical protein [Synergistaceae bacterium]
MRISVANTGLGRFIANPLARRTAAGGGLSRNSVTNDVLELSKFGGRLVIDGQAVNAWDSPVTNLSDEKSLRLMDRSISRIGNILERMKSLADLSTDNSLSDEDRIVIQIDLVKLNKELNAEKQKMSLRMAGQSESDIAKNLSGFEESANSVIEMLERARERASNGEAWDAAEVYQPESRVAAIEVQTPWGRQFFEGADGDFSGFELPSDIDPGTAIIINHLLPDGGSMIVTDDPNAPKLSAVLSGQNIPMVMDAESAKEISRKIGDQLKSLAKMKEELGTAARETRMEQFNAERQGVSQLPQVSEPHAVSSPNSDGKPKELAVQTSIGEMVYVDGDDNSVPVLRNPENAAGKMFAKLAKFFEQKIGNFYRTVIRNGAMSKERFLAESSIAAPKINGMGGRKPQPMG